MADILINVGVAVAALVVGHMVTRWWERARPLVVLSKFSGTTKASEPAQCDKDLHELTKQSFAMQVVSEGEVKYGELEAAHRAAKHDLDLNDNIDTWVADTTKAMREASNDQDRIEAIKTLFRWAGLRQFTEYMFYRSLCPGLSPSPVPQGQQPKLLVVSTDEEDGSLLVVFPDALGRLGANFKRDQWREQTIQPLVQAIAHLDTDFLVKVLEKIPALAVQQSDINRQIIEKTTPIRENHTQWVSHCAVVNYGSSPLIIWPTAYLLLKESRGAKKLKIKCYLAQEKDDGTDAVDLKGPVVASPGETIKIWAITKLTKQKLPDGNLVNAYFKDKTATGRTRLLLTQRGVPFKTSCKSTHLLFAEED